MYNQLSLDFQQICFNQSLKLVSSLMGTPALLLKKVPNNLMHFVIRPLSFTLCMGRGSLRFLAVSNNNSAALDKILSCQALKVKSLTIFLIRQHGKRTINCKKTNKQALKRKELNREIKEYIKKFHNEYLIIKRPCHLLNFALCIREPKLIPNL